MAYNGANYFRQNYDMSWYNGVTTTAVVVVSPQVPRFNPGDRVRHIYFGVGTVISSDFNWGSILFDIFAAINTNPTKVLYTYDNVVGHNLVHIDLVKGA